MYFFRINWAITGRTTSRHKGLTTSRRTAMGQQLLRIFWTASIARLTVWGRPSEVYFAPVDLKDWFCRIMFEKDFRHFAQPVKFSDTVHNLYEKNSLMEFWQSNTLTPYNGIQSLLLNNFNAKCVDQPTGQCHTLLPSVRVQADMLHDGILVHFDPEMSYRVIIHDPRCQLWVLWWFSWCHLQPLWLCFITMAISSLPLWMENKLIMTMIPKRKDWSFHISISTIYYNNHVQP